MQNAKKELNNIQKEQLAQIEKIVCVGTKEVVKERFVPRKKCGCKGHDGQAKKLYFTQKEALDVVNFQSAEVGLNVYPCPSGLGFHLTKNVAG